MTRKTVRGWRSGYPATLSEPAGLRVSVILLGCLERKGDERREAAVVFFSINFLPEACTALSPFWRYHC